LAHENAIETHLRGVLEVHRFVAFFRTGTAPAQRRRRSAHYVVFVCGQRAVRRSEHRRCRGSSATTRYYGESIEFGQLTSGSISLLTIKLLDVNSVITERADFNRE
jgi:hypothetical protein